MVALNADEEAQQLVHVFLALEPIQVHQAINFIIQLQRINRKRQFGSMSLRRVRTQKDELLNKTQITNCTHGQIGKVFLLPLLVLSSSVFLDGCALVGTNVPSAVLGTAIAFLS